MVDSAETVSDEGNWEGVYCGDDGEVIAEGGVHILTWVVDRQEIFQAVRQVFGKAADDGA